jgi:hypothetical protein
LLGGVWSLRDGRRALHWGLGLWGIVLLGFTGWLLVQLLAAYRGLAADPFFLARLGPGVPVATVGAAALAATLLVGSPPRPAGAAPPPAIPARPLVTGLAWLSAGAATIHFAVLGPHLRESWLLGAFFAIVAAAQMGWALVVALRPSPLVWAAGAIGNTLVILVWVVSRTRGWPLGADAGPEPIGVADGLSTAYETLLVAGAAALARRPAIGVQLRPGWARVAAWAVAALVAALTAVAVLSAVGAIRLLSHT